jgi:hypothetical protein
VDDIPRCEDPLSGTGLTTARFVVCSVVDENTFLAIEREGTSFLAVPSTLERLLRAHNFYPFVVIIIVVVKLGAINVNAYLTRCLL